MHSKGIPHRSVTFERRGKALSLKEVERIRRVFKETRNYTETGRRVGRSVMTVIQYVGAGRARLRRNIATGREIWKVATGEAGGNLAQAARLLSYRHGGGNIAKRIRKMGRWTEFRRRFPVSSTVSKRMGLNFERDIGPWIQKTRGNLSWIGQEVGILPSGVMGWIRRHYPKGSSPEERYRAFREDFPYSFQIHRKESERWSRPRRVWKDQGICFLPGKKVQRIRRVFRETRNYSETARRVGVGRDTVMKYLGKGRSSHRKGIATDEEIWRVTIEMQGKLGKAAKRLGYQSLSSVRARIRSMGRWEEFRKRFPVSVSPRSPLYDRLSFEKDLLPRLQETQGNTLWVADLIGIPLSGVWRWIERYYPKGRSRPDRYRAFRRDYPVHGISRRTPGWETEEFLLKRRAQGLRRSRRVFPSEVARTLPV